MLPGPLAPPMITRRRMRLGSSGSSFTASARLVSGPGHMSTAAWCAQVTSPAHVRSSTKPCCPAYLAPEPAAGPDAAWHTQPASLLQSQEQGAPSHLPSLATPVAPTGSSNSSCKRTMMDVTAQQRPSNTLACNMQGPTCPFTAPKWCSPQARPQSRQSHPRAHAQRACTAAAQVHPRTQAHGPCHTPSAPSARCGSRW